MDQHPVPQNISSYEFRLVGDMTLKQFFQLAGGIVTALLFFRSPLPGIIKWPLIIISVLTGILLAFVPVNGRPFSQWIMAFIKAVYSPTQYFWATPALQSPAVPAAITPVLPSSPVPPPPPAAPVIPASPPEIFESQLLSHFNKLYDSSSPPPQVPITTQTLYSKLDTKPAPVSAPSPIFTPPIAPEIAPSHLTPLVRLIPSIVPPTKAKPSPASSVLTPEHPNLLAGQITDSTGKSLEGTILEITDTTTNLPVRAMRSNKLGQFQTATPLKAGSYIIIAEKDGFNFDPISLTVQDQIIPPILIQAKA